MGPTQRGTVRRGRGCGSRFWQTLRSPLAPHPPSAPLLFSSNQYTSCFYSCLLWCLCGWASPCVLRDRHTNVAQSPASSCSLLPRLIPRPRPPAPGGQDAAFRAPGYTLVSSVGRGCDISNTRPLGGLPPSSHSSFPAPSTYWAPSACGPVLRVVPSRGAEAREAPEGSRTDNVPLCQTLLTWREDVNKTTPQCPQGTYTPLRVKNEDSCGQGDVSGRAAASEREAVYNLGARGAGTKEKGLQKENEPRSPTSRGPLYVPQHLCPSHWTSYCLER